MGLLQHLVVQCAVVLVVTTVSSAQLISSNANSLNGSKTCTLWCQVTINGRTTKVCCDNVSIVKKKHCPCQDQFTCPEDECMIKTCKKPPPFTPDMRCPIDNRSREDCPTTPADFCLSLNQTEACVGVGGPSDNCSAGEFCCYDACLGPVCKLPKLAGENNIIDEL